MDAGITGGRNDEYQNKKYRRLIAIIVAGIMSWVVIFWGFQVKTQASYIVPVYNLKSFTQGDNSSSVGMNVYFGQTLLYYFGYYSGTIDGDCGQVTYDSLRYYQLAYGLYGDGICGPITWKLLLKMGELSTSFSCRTIGRNYGLCLPASQCPESEYRCFAYQVDGNGYSNVYY